MFFKKDPLKDKKKEIAEYFTKITSWPMAQIGMEQPKGKKAVQAIEVALHSVNSELLNKTDSYVLAMAAAINTAQNAIQHNELLGACMLSASVMMAVGGKENLNKEEIEATKELASKGKKILLENKDNIDCQLNVNLVINMALNGLNQDKEVLDNNVDGSFT